MPRLPGWLTALIAGALTACSACSSSGSAGEASDDLTVGSRWSSRLKNGFYEFSAGGAHHALRLYPGVVTQQFILHNKNDDAWCWGEVDPNLVMNREKATLSGATYRRLSPIEGVFGGTLTPGTCRFEAWMTAAGLDLKRADSSFVFHFSPRDKSVYVKRFVRESPPNSPFNALAIEGVDDVGVTFSLTLVDSKLVESKVAGIARWKTANDVVHALDAFDAEFVQDGGGIFTLSLSSSEKRASVALDYDEAAGHLFARYSPKSDE